MKGDSQVLLNIVVEMVRLKVIFLSKYMFYLWVKLFIMINYIYLFKIGRREEGIQAIVKVSIGFLWENIIR